ncbi:MAG TPA: ABC-type transport auxiliary lipoprotein family protein [Steroidobacteraceae bacterium]|nr:ABC-type transport auxiliary lipoprotein family protein [Steroidobacteraceae bacterium]
MKHLRLPLVPLTLALGGCSGLFHSSAPQLQLYVLQAPAPQAANAARSASGPTLRLALPLPAPGLDTDRIALTHPQNRLDYYARSRWSAPLGEVFADLELATFRGRPAWSAVADDRSTLNTDYLLQTSIDRFNAEYAADSSPPRVRVELHCLLIRRGDGALLGSFGSSADVQAQANRMGSVVAAFSAAADAALVAVADQAQAMLRSAKSPAAP